MNQRPDPVTVSPRAAKRVKALIEKEGNNKLMLRIGVNGGGCSGFQYEFKLDDTKAPGDTAVEKDGITVLIDEMSLMYLLGSEVDYAEELVGSYFKITNPNASSSCGCGTSFSV